MKRHIKTLTFLWVALFATCVEASPGTISAGYKSVLYLNGSGDLFGWGANNVGQLGDGSEIDRPQPVIPSEAGPWSAVSVSLQPVDASSNSAHSLAIKVDGTLWAWGDNSRGQLGQGDTVNRSAPTQVGSASTWRAVAAGSGFSMALKNNGEVWVWGDNSYGQLGPGVSVGFSSTPAQLADKEGDNTSDTFIAIAAGVNHALAIHGASAAATYGQIYAWGRNSEGQLGLGHNNAVGGLRLVSSSSAGQLWRVVEAGIHSSFALDSSSKLYAWGEGSFGSLGIGDNLGTSIQQASSPTLTLNSSISSMVYESVSAGADHTLAVASGGGAIYGTGVKAGLAAANTGGADRYTKFTYLNLNLPTGASVDAVGTGLDYSIIALDTGVVLSTGNNGNGQLGNGTTDGSSDFGDTAIGQFDLSIVEVTVESEVIGLRAGDAVQFKVKLQNTGSGAVDISDSSGFFAAKLVPVEGSSLVGKLSLLSIPNVPANTILGPSSVVSFTLTGAVPAGVSVGEYRIEVEADAAQVFDEFNEVNNSALSVVSENSPAIIFTADLENSGGLTLAGVAPAAVGELLQVNLGLQNTGTGVIKAAEQPGYKLRFLLTPNFDDFTGPNVIELDPLAGAAALVIDVDLDAGGANPFTDTIDFTIPNGVEPIGYYLVMLIDVDAELAETNEANNRVVSGTKLVSIAPLDFEDAVIASSETDPIAITRTGNSNWYGFAFSGVDGGDAAYSPQLAADQQASFRTTVANASILRFNWRASTSGASNYLQLSAGAQVLTISGETEWQEVSVAVGAGTDVIWTFFSGSGGAGEQVFVDNLSIEPITGPDVLVPGALLLDDSYTPIDSDQLVAGLDAFRMVYELRNQGQGAATNSSFDVKTYLSKDRVLDPAEDTEVGAISHPGMASGASDSIIRQYTPPSNLFGDYYIIIEVSGVAGETDAAVLANNIYVSETALINIRPLPDLSLALTSINRNIFYSGNSLLINYQLENWGYGDAFGTIQLRLVLSEDQRYDAGEDMTIGEGFYFAGIAAGTPFSPNSKTAGFSLFSFPAGLPIGDFKYLGMVIDSAGAFAESDESNNAVFFENPAYAFGSISLTEALDRADSPLSYSIRADETAPFSEGYPFFGVVTAEASDGTDAARSAVIDDGDISYFEVEVTVPEGSDYILNFDWKVSSEIEDKFYLYIDDGSTSWQQAVISGEVGWTSDYVLLPGHPDDGNGVTALDKTYTLRWSYEKNATLSAGDDLAWVDQIRVEALTKPDFTISGLFLEDFDGNQADSVVPFLIGQDRITLDARLRNIGTAYDGSPPTDVKFYLSQDQTIGDNDVLLGSEVVGSLNPGATQETQLSFELTNAALSAGFYYILAVVDEEAVVAEQNENNNTFITATRLVELIELPDLEIIKWEFSDALGLHLAGSALPQATVTLRNNGAASVLNAFLVQFSLRDVLTDEKIDLVTSTRNETLAGGAEQIFKVTLSAPTSEALQGRRFYLEATVDSTEVVTESNEKNNVLLFDDPAKVLIFSEADLEEGLSSDSAFLGGIVSENIKLEKSEIAPFPSTSPLPFVSVNETFAGVFLPVARSIAIGAGETAKFTVNLPDLTADQAFTFEWKADDLSSADFSEALGGTFQVQLDPEPDPAAAEPPSPQMNEFDWTAQKLQLPAETDNEAGTNNVTWSFTRENQLDADKLDVFAYVRELRFLPNLTISLDDNSIEDGSGGSGFSPGSTIQFDATIQNTALGEVQPGETITVEARLSSDQSWDSNDFFIGKFQVPEDADLQDFVDGASETFTFSGTIPPEIANGDYHLLLRIDPDATTAAGDDNGPGQVLEVSDTDNDTASGLASIRISTKSLGDGLDLDENAVANPVDDDGPMKKLEELEPGFYQDYNKTVFPGFLPGKVVQTGDASWASSPDIEVQDLASKWYATATEVQKDSQDVRIPTEDNEGNLVASPNAVDDDAIRTGALNAGSAASLLFRLNQPRLVRFRVKANTANSSNYLFFGANGNALRPEGNRPTRFSGVQDDFQELYYVVPAEAPVGFTYVQGTAPATTGNFVDGEFVYVDDLKVLDPIEKPDFVVDTLQYAAGSYVLQRDQLFLVVTGSNRGRSVAPDKLPDGFKVRVWLENSDKRIEIGTMEDFQQLDGSTRFAYQSSLNLPDSLAEGNYYLIARVDADNKVPEFAIDLSTGLPSDNEPAAFSDGDNNFLISSAADVFIDRRADLRIAPSLDAVYNEVRLAGPARQSEAEIVDFFVIEATSAEGPSELLVKFDLINEGLSGVSAADADDFAINVYAASSRDEAPAPERLITSFLVEDGLAAGSRRTFEVTTAIPDYIDAGSFYYLNIVADGDGIIAESDEEDNNTFSRNRNVFVSDVSLEVALNDEALDRYTWDYSFVVPTQIDSTLQAPFFGTRDEFGQDNSDSGVRAAAQSGPVGVGGTSWLQKTVNVTDGDEVQVSFLWKVSSQFEITPAGIVEDILEFSIRFQGEDTFTPIAKISGERDWAEYIYTITEQGLHTLRWTYIENGDDARAGADAGWVDDYSEASFDFIPVLGQASDTYSAGDLLDLPAYVWNLGQLQIPDSGVEVELRLAQETGDVSNLDWTVPSSSDVTLQDKVRYDQLTLQQLVGLKNLIEGLEVSDNVKDTALAQALNTSMDVAILELLKAEESEIEPELETAQIDDLRNILGDENDEQTWLDFADADLALILADAGTALEQAARRRFLPVRTYRYLDASGNLSDSRKIKIPPNLSEKGPYFFGMWVNPQDLLTESNRANNLKYSDSKSVTLNVETTIPEALDLGTGDLLSSSNDWNLSGEGRWFAVPELEVDPDAVDDDEIRSPRDEISQDGEASISALVEGPRVIKFKWRSELADTFDSASFFVNGELALREYENSDPSSMSLSSEDDSSGWKPEQYFLPAGLNEIRWTFVRGNDANGQGKVYLDDVKFEDKTEEADLAISRIDYTGAGYALERDAFPVTVTVLNRGAMPAMPAEINYNDLDVELRLGKNKNFDDAVQIVGNIGVVDVLDQGQRLVFQGNIDLPSNLAQGTYYLLARVKSFDPSFVEFTYNNSKMGDPSLVDQELLNNNDFASAAQDVTIRHLPQLLVRTTYVENEKLFYPKEAIRFDWEVENIGLGDIPFGTDLTQTVELWSVDVEEENPSIENGQKVLDIGTVTETTALPGRLTATDSSQSTIQYKEVFRLPTQAELLGALGAVDTGLEDLDLRVVSALGELEKFKFFLVLTRDNSIEQSSELSVNAVTDELFRISAFPYDPAFEEPALEIHHTRINFGNWQTYTESRLESLGVTPSSGDGADPFSPGGFENLYYYAFNLPLLTNLTQSSPRVERRKVGRVDETAYYLTRNVELASQTRKIERVQGGSHVNVDVDVAAGTYRAITFPIVRGATDLVYRVQMSTDGGSSWKDHLDIEPPYLDERFGFTAGFAGSRSLTEVNQSDGAISLFEMDEKIVSVVDNNYTATVTVRAENPATTELMRVVVVPQELAMNEQLVIDFFTASGVYDYQNSEIRPFGDFDGDGLSNIAELQLGFDPLVVADPASLPTSLEAFVAEEMAKLGVLATLEEDNSITPPSDIAPGDNLDGDGYDNQTELLAGTDPTDPGSSPAAPSVELFIAEQWLAKGTFNTNTLIPVENTLIPVVSFLAYEDFDGDGLNNVSEFALAGRDSADDADALASTALEKFVVTVFTDPLAKDGLIPDVAGEGYGLFGNPLAHLGPNDDYDADGSSNIAEILLSFNPTLNNDAGLISNLEAYTVEGLASFGVYSLPIPENIAPRANQDGDFVNNALELMLGFDPTDESSGPAQNTLEFFVAEQLVLGNAFEKYSVQNYGPQDDLDGDGSTNIAELQLGRDPSSNADVNSTNLASDLVAEEFAMAYGLFAPAPLLVDPEDDYDADGFSNIEELVAGTSLVNPSNFPANETESALLEAFALAGVIAGEDFDGVTIDSADLEADADFDGDGRSNLLEYALGGDLSDFNHQPETLSTAMSGTDFTIGFVRLKASKTPSNLEITPVCSATVDGAYVEVSPGDITESLSADQTNLPSSSYERVELTVDTTTNTCAFFKINVSIKP